MNAPFLQSTRAGRLATVLGADALVLLRFAGSDRLSGLYGYEVDCLSTTPDIDFDALVGTHATVTLVTHRGEARPFDGIVTEARWLGVGENGHRYRLTLKPWFWLATRRRNQRIFHDKTVVEILQELLAAYAGAGPLEVSVTGDYPKLEYTVQYRESDFAFASRMMERFGLSYHFQHEAGSHKMVVTDAAESHPSVGTRKFRGYGSPHHAAEEHFHAWAPARRITTGAVRLIDYNFKTPTAAMEVDRTGDAAHAEGQIESFDWPGDYLDQGQGKGVVARATGRERGQDQRYEALGDAMSLAAGLKVTLGGDAVPGTGGEFLCLLAEHSYTSDAYGSGEGAVENAYSGRYVLMPSDAPLLPEKKTPAAVVQGPQTAVVVGEGEIDCDEYGRILVRFHWDLEGAWSMRCRVSQNWGGGGWGGMVIPRIGMEVVVEFLEGDPDKPLVTGCVYNGKNDVPYPLPAHKTKSVFRSKTHKGEGFNEISFEDETGAENIALHAQKDQTLKVLNNRMKRVDNDQTESVGQNKSIDVGKNHQEKIGGSMNLTVGGDGFGGALGLMGALGGLLGSGASTMAIGAKAVGDGPLGTLVGGLLASTLAGELASSPGHGTFAAAGRNREEAGLDQASTGTQLGNLVGKIMPISGILTTFVEKAVSDTIGLARTEQIGLLKNTFVGQVQTTTVGKKQITTVGETQHAEIGKFKKTIVGEEYVIEVGKTKLIMRADGTVILKGVRFNFEAEGPVQVVGKVIDLN
jgi:type VI secretion system secreted protein VgrG